ncbi:uncharacterized protein [Mytilus edulis]|uniref:uncharacterized protein isoform X3 n=2 Tax=Mytilus edulis TaxID=6550 RepID=UPI0039EF8049
MGVKGIHERSGSTEIWCIFRAPDAKRTCKCQTGPNSDPDTEDFGCQVELEDMDESFQLADTSFCSMKSTANMDQGELAEQLALVQEMVQEMKHGFSSAMEELAKIQFGDQKLQQQMTSERDQHELEVKDLTGAVNLLREDIKSFSSQLNEVSDTQKNLEEKVNSMEWKNKNFIKEELERLGISDKNRSSPAPSRNKRSPSPTKDVSPMVHPYLASLQQQQQKNVEEDNQSITALACKSLNLSQALHEKCLHLDMSVSTSDEEEAVRMSKMPSFPVAVKESSYYQETHPFAPQKIPPHEQLMEEVQREKIAQEMVDAEKSYCSHLWTIIDGYMNTLRQEELMSSRELSEMFPPVIPHIYEQHCIMLRKMEERLLKWKYSGIMGDLYVRLTDPQNIDGLALYKDYITEFPSVINSMNLWFAQSARFRDIMRSSCLASSSIVPLLLAPLQQIPKYSLLIKNMLKFTSSDHPDRYYLESSLSRLKNFLNTMNDDLEGAMQFLNIGKPPISRSRDSGNSVRSQSSGSSCEANRVSSARDSGIHSNGEDMGRHAASPATTRRYVLQVLRDRREREQTGEHFHNGPALNPMRPNVHAFGSHPDLSGPEYHDYFGNVRHVPAYMPYQNGQKMYSSLTKIPTKSPERGQDKPARKIKIRKRPDSQKSLPLPNSNYLRPLTPHLPMGGLSSRDSFDDQAVPRKKQPSRRQMRPASSIDFSHADIERREMFAKSFTNSGNFNQEDSYQRGRNEFSPEIYERKESHQEKLYRQSQLNSPRGQPGEGRARNDLHMSLQKLLAERQKADLDKQRQDNYEENHPYANDPPFRPLASSSVEENIDINNEPPKLPPKNAEQVEDYGIFGDDDEEEEEDEDDYEYDDDYRDRKPVPENQNVSRLQEVLENSDTSSPEPVTIESEQSVSQSRSKHYEMDSDHEEQSLTESLSLDHTISGSSTHDQNLSGKGEESEKLSSEERSTKRDRKMRPENLVPMKPERRKTVASTNPMEVKSEEINSESERRHSFVQGQKPPEEFRKPDTINSESDKNQLSIFSGDSDKRMTKPLSLKARQMDAFNIAPPKEATFSASQLRSRQGTARKLPQVNGRFSVPVFDSNYKSKIPTPPLSPTDSKSSKTGSVKETKIPVYSPLKKKGEKSSTENISRSTEDVSKLKKKSHFKDSIKSFFGRKRPGNAEDSGNFEFEDRQIQV